MSIITILSPKGGAGRTTAVMALASALVETGNHRPLVIDASREITGCRRESTLAIWHGIMQRCGVKKDQIGFRQAATTEELERIIQHEEDKRLLMRPPILIDTSARLDDLDLAAADHADVILSPFVDALTAQRVSVALDPFDISAPIYGMRCGHAFEDTEGRAVLAAFTVGRLLQHGLPESEIISEISIGGHLPSMCLQCLLDHADEPLASPARIKRARSVYAMQRELRKLVNEVILALDGYELRPRQPRARRHPLP